MNEPVQAHYAAADIVARIFAAIGWSASDAQTLRVEQLFPFDQLHGRELLATQEHAARLAPARGSQVLDVGSGIGGPARYFASTIGCHVTGIDLTPEFVAAANELTALCGLSDLANFIQADATEMPFAANAFDKAYCFYVGMNLPKKQAVLRECWRALKPGGNLLWTEATLGEGDPLYPLPWSRTAEHSYVETSASLVERCRQAGFEVISIEDETGAHIELARQIRLSGKTPTEGQRQANEVVLGEDFAQRRKNYITSLAEGRIASTLLELVKPV